MESITLIDLRTAYWIQSGLLSGAGTVVVIVSVLPQLSPFAVLAVGIAPFSLVLKSKADPFAEYLRPK